MVESLISIAKSDPGSIAWMLVSGFYNPPSVSRNINNVIDLLQVMKVMKFETKEIAYQQFVLTRLIQLMRCLAFFIMVLHETFQLFLVDFVCIEFGCLISLIK